MSPSHTAVTDAALANRPDAQDAPCASTELPPIEINHGSCRRVTPILARIGDKWSILTVMTLADGTRRFNELKRAIDGISQRMLTLTLRGLERDGMVARRVYPTIPPRVDYTLTDLGRSLCVPVLAFGSWVQDHLDEIDAARIAFDLRQENEEEYPVGE